MKSHTENKFSLVVPVAILLVAGAIMAYPVDQTLRILSSNVFGTEYFGLALKMGVAFLIGFLAVRKLKLRVLAGLSGKYPWRFKALNLIPAYLFVLGILSVASRDLSLIQWGNLALLLFACLMVGFAEEYLFRGMLLGAFLKKFGAQKHGVFLSIALSALLFGLFHLTNLLKNDNVGQVLVQVGFASFIGFFFAALLLKTNKLVPIAVTHGLINFFFSLAMLPGIKVPEEDTGASLAPLILFLPLLIIGIFIYQKIDKDELLEKIKA